MQFRKWFVSENRKQLAQAFRGTLGGVPQDPVHHPEGDALTHTQLVRRAIPRAIQELQALKNDPNLANTLSDLDFNIGPEEKQILALATWVHDIGKASATKIKTADGERHWSQPGEPGKIHSIGHEDAEHYLPALEKLRSSAPQETVDLYLKNQELINFLIEHHMDFIQRGELAKQIVAQYFVGGKIKNDPKIKLLLLLMWSDKMGRRPESTIAKAISSNTAALQASVKRSLIPPPVPNKPFEGSPEDFAKMMASKPMPRPQKINALKGKFPQISDADIARLIPEGFRAFFESEQGPATYPAKIPVSQDVRVLADALKQGDSSVQVYVVGGAVRDWLYHHFHAQPGEKFSAKDEDVTTNLSEEEILARLRSPYAQQKGIKVSEKDSVDTFGVVFASVSGHPTIEIAPFRKDIGGTDGRRPDRIERGTLQDDAMRRDLTMNNLYYDFEKQVVIDLNPAGQGIDDVKNGVARPVGDADQRFEEDKLRVLRLIRFFSRFNSGSIKQFLDPQTLAAIAKYKDLNSFSGITPERIEMEFLAGIKQAKSSAAFLSNLAELDLMQAVFPGLSVDVQGISRLGNTKSPRVILAWLLRGNQNIAGHLNRLKYPNEITDSVQFLINAMNFGTEQAIDMVKARDRRLVRGNKVTPADQQKNQTLSSEMKSDLLELSKIMGVQAPMQRMQHLAQYQPPAISGAELMQQGFRGEDIGKEQKNRAMAHYTQSFDDYVKGSSNEGK